MIQLAGSPRQGRQPRESIQLRNCARHIVEFGAERRSRGLAVGSPSRADARKDSMKALTIRQLWAYAILHLGKDVENRSWRTHYRGPLLIHAASYHERQPREKLAENICRPPSAETLANLPEGSIVGIARVVGCVKNSESRWAQKGAWHRLIKNPRRMRPIPCKGSLGLWIPPPAVMKELPAWVKQLDLK